MSQIQASQTISLCRQANLTKSNRFSQNLKYKPFVRKPSITKRQSFASPSFIKHKFDQNINAKDKFPQTILKFNNENGSRSVSIDSINRYRSLSKNNLLLKGLNNKIQGQLINGTQIQSNKLIKNQYFNQNFNDYQNGSQFHKTQKLFNIQKNTSHKQQTVNKKQNILRSSIKKKQSLTQYFQKESLISRSSKQSKNEINFIELKNSMNLNQYIARLQQYTSKFQKDNYTLKKKCQWMSQQIQMHLQKQQTQKQQTQKCSIQIEIQSKQIQKQTHEIQQLKKDNQNLSKQIIQSTSTEQIIQSTSSKQIIQSTSSKRNRISTCCQTMNSNKQINNKNMLTSNQIQTKGSKSKQKRLKSIQSLKVNSFKTYPGVIAYKTKHNGLDKTASIQNQSSQENQQNHQQKSILSINQHHQVLINQNDLMKKQIQTLNMVIENGQTQIKQLKQNSLYLAELLKQKQKIIIQVTQQTKLNIKQFQQHIKQLQMNHEEAIQNILLQNDFIQNNYKQQTCNLQQRIKQLCTRQWTSSINRQYCIDIQNPLHSLLLIPKQNSLQNGENLLKQNQSLRSYIIRIVSQFKYLKIQNRMLLKIKEDLTRLQKQKNQIKYQRDTLKKRLIQIHKNNSHHNHNNHTNHKHNNHNNHKQNNSKHIHNNNSKYNQDFDDSEDQFQKSIKSEDQIFDLSYSQILNTTTDDVNSHP